QIVQGHCQVSVLRNADLCSCSALASSIPFPGRRRCSVKTTARHSSLPGSPQLLGRRFESRRVLYRRPEPRRAGAVPEGVTNPYIGKLRARSRASQQEASAAHVSAADELRRETQPLAKRVQQGIDVLAGSDAAQEDHLTAATDLRCQAAYVMIERLA